MRVQYVVANPRHQVGSYVREGDLGRGLTIRGSLCVRIWGGVPRREDSVNLFFVCLSSVEVRVSASTHTNVQATTDNLEGAFVRTDLEISKST